MVTVNGVQMEIDALDADFIERFERAAGVLGEKDAGTPKDSLTAAMRYQCRCIRAFLDAVFGKGTGKAVLPKDNIGEAFAAVEDISNEVRRQRETYEARLQRYRPNRMQRRAE